MSYAEEDVPRLLSRHFNLTNRFGARDPNVVQHGDTMDKTLLYQVQLWNIAPSPDITLMRP